VPETTRDTKLVEFLNEAYGKEQQLTAALEQHLQTTTRPDYEKRLTEHLKETKAHARNVSKRIKQLGEIATYTVIDSLATAVGDSETAQLARNILREEERMQKYLGELLRDLTVDMTHDEVPVSEINGPAARRTAPRQKASTR
jgi:ferritin-like metal-binding protein YciE